MSGRLAAAATAALAALTAAPAGAAVFPVCTARLANAASNARTWCDTDATPRMTGSGTIQRIVTVEVAAGAVQATVTCGYGTNARSATLTSWDPKPRTLAIDESTDGACRTELVALTGGTTAAAVSRFAYRLV